MGARAGLRYGVPLVAGEGRRKPDHYPLLVPTEEEEKVPETQEEDRQLPQEVPPLAPSLRLAGIDEEDTWEPNVVRGID